MVMWLREFLMGMVTLAVIGLSPAAAWEKRDDARVFFFGNSLIHHLTESDTTTMPHWLALLARYAGKDFAADGLWGFPRNFAAELPPSTLWEFKEVSRIAPLWTPVRASLYDTFVLTTENYIQGNPPTQLYQGENTEQQSPFEATLAIIDWIEANSDGSRILIYEGWPGFDPEVKDFPPAHSDIPGLVDYAVGPYHKWYGDLIEALHAARPESEIHLIPIGLVLAEVIRAPEFSALPPETFFSDLSPHGTATTYLLAAMITYAAVYGERPPAGFPVPDVIAPALARNYEAAADLVWREVQAADAG